jgi:hypothetical protein
VVEAIDLLEGSSPHTFLKYWLPRSLPSRVKLIVTVASSSTRALTFFKEIGAKIVDYRELEADLDQVTRAFFQDRPNLQTEFCDELSRETSLYRLRKKLQLLEWMAELQKPRADILQSLGRLW